MAPILYALYLAFLSIASWYHGTSHLAATTGQTLPSFHQKRKWFNIITALDFFMYGNLSVISWCHYSTWKNAFTILFILEFGIHVGYWILHSFFPKQYAKIHRHEEGGTLYSDGQSITLKATFVWLDTLIAKIGIIFISLLLLQKTSLGVVAITMFIGLKIYKKLWQPSSLSSMTD
jgi:hypothetical protein